MKQIPQNNFFLQICYLLQLDKQKEYQYMKKRCKFGENCWNLNQCKFYHSPHKNYMNKPNCRHGSRCYNLNCKFYHPQSLEQQAESVYSYNQTITKPQIFPGSQENTSQFSEKIEKESCLTVAITKEETESLSFIEVPSKKAEFYEIYVAQQEYLEKKLEEFFNIRLIKDARFDAIYNYLLENSDPNDVDLLTQIIEKIQEQIPVAILDFGYGKLVKTIVKKKYEYSEIIEQLNKQIEIRIKKQEKQKELLAQFPNLVQYKVLEDSDLINQDVENCMFLIDGNNTLPTHKIFRKYYHSKSKQLKAEGQIRLQWLISNLPHCSLFFDYKYQQYYTEIQNRIMYPGQPEQIHKHKVFFADKDKEEDADKLILQTLALIDEKSKVILISGDRILIQKAFRIKPKNLLISSGLFFTKFCKEFIRRKFFGNKIKKGVIKRIFVDLPSTEKDNSEEQKPQIAT